MFRNQFTLYSINKAIQFLFFTFIALIQPNFMYSFFLLNNLVILIILLILKLNIVTKPA